MLKSAYVALGGNPDDRHLQRAIGHDLRAALDLAGELGFHSTAHHLPEIVDILRDPYKAHYFRYRRPEKFPLPDFANLEQALVTLAGRVEACARIDDTALPAHVRRLRHCCYRNIIYLGEFADFEQSPDG